MKITKILVIFAISITILNSISCQGRDGRGFERTPKALDLEDHFGTEAVQNLYGPQAHFNIPDIAREYDSVEGPRQPTPITNLNEEIKPEEHVHGDLNNTAYDASRIIKPEYAHPKAEIDTNFVHEAIVNTPVHVGTYHQSQIVKSQNRQTGEISEKVVSQNKPIVGIVKNLRQVETKRKTFVDIQNGQIINTQKPTMLHGV